jgi:hypothetical protein
MNQKYKKYSHSRGLQNSEPQLGCFSIFAIIATLVLNKGDVYKIERLMGYMKNASALFDSKYVGMTPRLYQVVIFSK